MKLYFSPGSCSLAVRIAIHELGVACEFESVDLKTKKTQSGADFLKINPKGAVPTLAISDKEVLTENAVIQQFLAEKNKGTELLPPTGMMERYRVLEWLNFVATDLHKCCSPLFNSQVSEEQKTKVFKPLLVNKLNWVNTALKSQKFLTGEHFTLPDAYLFTILTWVPKFKMPLTEWPEINRYYNELKKRKSVVQALKEENLTNEV